MLEHVHRGLADGAGASAVFAALSRWLAPRSPHQMMAGWARGLYTPRQAVARAVEHGFRIPALRDQLRCVRARGSGARGVSARWGIEPVEPTVTLPEPSRTLYLRERDLIDAWTAGAGLAPDQVCLGGGSVLAAWWKHRDSDDLDGVVQGETAYAEMLSAGKTLDALAESRGGTVSWVNDLQAVRIAWRDLDSGATDKIEFFGEAESPPEHAERSVNLEGRSTRILGIRQILWGKLERCLKRITSKDVFDLREAGLVTLRSWLPLSTRGLAGRCVNSRRPFGRTHQRLARRSRRSSGPLL